MDEYADKRAHDVAWMTAAERDEYQRQIDRLDQKIRTYEMALRTIKQEATDALG